MERLDTVVIGAGVVGLAVARECALRGGEVLVLEAEHRFGIHASSRNSEVIHAGIYHAPGTLKAETCVHGKELLYRYCREREIAHQRIGKLLIAVEPTEIGLLHGYVARAASNGVHDVRLLRRGEWEAMEPALQAIAAAYSPSSGIVDAHGVMTSVIADIERNSGVIAYRSEVLGGRALGDGFELSVGGGTGYRLGCRRVINCAGARAPRVALNLGTQPGFVPRAYFARGHYLALSGASPFRHLIYPMPQPGGLGIHLTLDLAGRARFGPDVEWIDDIDYDFSADLELRFRGAIARYFPAIAERELQADYCGVRAKIAGPGEADADFMVAGAEQHGISGLINLFGIESPGLTASFAIANRVADQLERG